MRTGDVFDHVHLRVRDIDASRHFYAAAAEALSLGPMAHGDGWFEVGELYVSDDGPPTTDLHLAFSAANRDAVRRFHEAALGAGGRDNGRPGVRTRYGPGYYAAYVLDPDGTNVEAVIHERAQNDRGRPAAAS